VFVVQKIKAMFYLIDDSSCLMNVYSNVNTFTGAVYTIAVLF
jgi:hypothetical protein